MQLLKLAGSKFPFIRFKRNILERNPIFKLPDGKMLVLPESWFVKYADLFEFSDDDPKIPSALHRQHQGLLNGHPLLAGDINSRLAENQKKIYTGENQKSFPIPAGFNGYLRDYQQKGFDWLCMMAENKLGACLADDMGLGKTIQVIALAAICARAQVDFSIQPGSGSKQHSWICSLQSKNLPLLPSLIVMAPSLIHNWEKELAEICSRIESKAPFWLSKNGTC
jgi:SNF2 family DNA or RNA helicase